MDTRELIEQLHEYTALKYAGNCKCGKCQLIHIDDIYNFADALSSQAAEIERLREALGKALVWHEEQDKSPSKQQPSHGPNGNQWARLQHQEQMAEIRAALTPKPNKEGE